MKYLGVKGLNDHFLVQEKDLRQRSGGMVRTCI